MYCILLRNACERVIFVKAPNDLFFFSYTMARTSYKCTFDEMMMNVHIVLDQYD